MKESMRSIRSKQGNGQSRFAPFVMLVLLMAGCGGSSARTGVDYDPKVNFRDYRTYSWRNGTPSANSLMDQRIIRSIERELRRKGLQEVSSGGDLRVAYHLSFDRRLEIFSWDYLSGPYWSDTWSRRTEVRAVPEGLLVVDLIDGRRNQLVWRGVATDELTESETDMESRIGYVTAELFEDYPPDR
jgi:hypothetical protein